VTPEQAKELSTAFKTLSTFFREHGPEARSFELEPHLAPSVRAPHDRGKLRASDVMARLDEKLDVAAQALDVVAGGRSLSPAQEETLDDVLSGGTLADAKHLIGHFRVASSWSKGSDVSTDNEKLLFLESFIEHVASLDNALKIVQKDAPTVAAEFNDAAKRAPQQPGAQNRFSGPDKGKPGKPFIIRG
jgi:hypothetical protein